MRGRQTTPRPAAQADARRVLVDVVGDAGEGVVGVEHARVEAALEEVAGARVPAVEPHRVNAVQPLHPARQLRLRRLDEQVEVVVEQVPRVQLPAETPRHVDEQLEPRFAIAVVEDDRPLFHAAAGHVVVRRARQLAARDPRHAADAIAPSAAAKPP
jgi:hypothetical protein